MPEKFRFSGVSEVLSNLPRKDESIKKYDVIFRLYRFSDFSIINMILGIDIGIQEIDIDVYVSLFSKYEFLLIKYKLSSI